MAFATNLHYNFGGSADFNRPNIRNRPFYLHTFLTMNIIGISAFYHDSAVALVQDGYISAAFQEERFTRVKHDERFPAESLKYLISKVISKKNIEIDAIVFYEKPLQKFDRILENYLAFAPLGFVNFRDSIPVWSQKKLFQRKQLRKEITSIYKELGIPCEQITKKLYFSDHHLSHAASAYFPSPFKDACVVTLDGVGEWTSTAIYSGQGNDLTPVKRIEYPNSLGFLYSTITALCGFKVNSGEYKLMGLAPYGSPRFTDVILSEIIRLHNDGSFSLNQEYFDYMKKNRMYSKKLLNLFNIDARTPESRIESVHCDLASSIQKVLEIAVLNLVDKAKQEVGSKNLCLSGGVALNCVANSVIVKSGLFENVWVQPASGDAGGALGAALAFEHMGASNSQNVERKPPPNKKSDFMSGAYLGREFSDEEILESLILSDLIFVTCSSADNMIQTVAFELSEGMSVGWFQGKSEFGPRALGSRSILADPRSAVTQKRLNLQTKFRESFRPFAPSVLEEDYKNWFDWNSPSPYMLFVADIKIEHRSDRYKVTEKSEGETISLEQINDVRSCVPAITHVDFSARLQTVSKSTNPLYHSLISAFKSITGVPMLVNTSFNIRGEPIVDSPQDAIRCFLGTDIDLLVLGNYIVRKNDNVSKMIDYREIYKLD